MKRVLITGASGFVGRHSLGPLAARGYEVHAVRSRGPAAADAPQSVRWHECDLLDSVRTRALISIVRPTHLLHFAWYATPGKFWTAPENLRWVGASLDLFQMFAEAGGQRIVAAGTCAEYEWTGDEPCSELSTPLRPTTLYGLCKQSVGAVLEAFAAQSNLSAAWGRIFFLYGPHEHPVRLVSSVIRSFLRGEPAFCSHGRQVRDFLHAADAAGAFVALLDGEVTGAVNIASGHPTAVQDVIHTIADKLNSRDLVRLDALTALEGEPRVLVADVKRLTEEVGYSPKRDLCAGLEETILWWQEQIAEGRFAK